MSTNIKIGITAFLGMAGLVVLILGLVAQIYSVSLSVVFAAIIWTAATLVYLLVRERKTGRGITRTITDNSCREAITRHPR